jgi:hypothetical protein
MAKLQRFIPQSPDPYLKQGDQLGSVKFGHLNALVDAINSTIYGDYLQLAGSGPMSTTLKALEDPDGNLAQLFLAIDKTAISGPLKVGDSSANNASAILEISSTTKGVLFPKMTVAQRDAIVSPAIGLMIYNTDEFIINSWDGTEWTTVGGGGLNLQNDALMTSTLTPIVDKDNTVSALSISTEKTKIESSQQCPLEVESTGVGGGIALLDNTTTNNTSVGIGALGNALCFRSGGVEAGNMRLLDTGTLTLFGNALTDFVPLIPTGGAVNITGGNQETYNGSVYVVTGAVTIDINNAVREGFNVSIIQADANQTTFTCSGGTLTLRNRQGHTQTAGQYACVTLIRIGNDVILAGDTA